MERLSASGARAVSGWLLAATLSACGASGEPATDAAAAADASMDAATIESRDVGPTSCGARGCAPDEICVNYSGDGDIGGGPIFVCRQRPADCAPDDCSMGACCSVACVNELCSSGCGYARVAQGVLYCI